MNQNLIKLSIITVVKDGSNSISKTIENCKEILQNYVFEHIIIEGDHVDNTSTIIQQYQNNKEYAHLKAFKLHGPENKGIYKAMNRGIELAQGQFILFINSGDLITNELVDLVYNNNLARNTIYSGNILQVDSEYNELRNESKPNYLLKFPLRMPLNHQATLK